MLLSSISPCTLRVTTSQPGVLAASKHLDSFGATYQSVPGPGHLKSGSLAFPSELWESLAGFGSGGIGYGLLRLPVGDLSHGVWLAWKILVKLDRKKETEHGIVMLQFVRLFSGIVVSDNNTSNQCC